MDSEFPAKSAFFIKYSSHIDRQVGRVQQGWHGGHGTVINMVDSVKSSRGKSEKNKSTKFLQSGLKFWSYWIIHLAMSAISNIGCIRGVQGLILFYWLLGICNSGLERYFALQPCSKTPSWWHHKIPLSILSFSLCIIWIPSKSSWMHRRRHRKVFYRPGICSSGVMHC